MTLKVLAYIREADCIGCTKCIDACPTDAIIGTRNRMHTVIQSDCIGCRLCIEPCPVDCITLISADKALRDVVHYRKLAQRKKARMATLDQIAKIKHHTLTKPLVADKTDSAIDKQAFIAAALERAKAKKLNNN